MKLGKVKYVHETARDKPKFHLARHVACRHDSTRSICRLSSPCILAVPILSNCTARHARLDALYASNVSSYVETWRHEPSGIWIVAIDCKKIQKDFGSMLPHCSVELKRIVAERGRCSHGGHLYFVWCAFQGLSGNLYCYYNYNYFLLLHEHMAEWMNKLFVNYGSIINYFG